MKIKKLKNIFCSVGNNQSCETSQIDINDNKDFTQWVDNDALLILLLKGKVLFPGLMVHISFDKKESHLVSLLRKIYEQNLPIGTILKKDELPTKKLNSCKYYDYGVIAEILDIKNTSNDKNIHFVIRGKAKFKLNKVYLNQDIKDNFLLGSISEINEDANESLNKKEAMYIDSLKDATLELLQRDPDFSQYVEEIITGKISPLFLTYFATSITTISCHLKQRILEEPSLTKKVKLALGYILKDIDLLKLRHSVKSKVYKGLTKQQKEFYIRQEIDALKHEIGENDDNNGTKILLNKSKKKKWSKETKEHFMNCINKLERTNYQSPEYSVNYNHAEFFVDLPWGETTKDNFNLVEAEKVLNKGHHGMEKIKDRILEHLAVIKLRGSVKKSPILCLTGPPGIGKTSLGKSIAEALGRKYARISLGAVNDEADIRGHRKTYIGAMPGKILYNIKKVKSSNPVIVFDEIDKMNNHKGLPEAALLEVLDPEQNDTFTDNYVEVPYDLSNVLFIATANSVEDISYPLRDRMEILELSGYSTEEKIEIAKKHIVPEQIMEHGLMEKEIKLKDKAIEKIIEDYTCESGVRGLKRKIAELNRKVAKCIVLDKEYKKQLGEKEVTELLGIESYISDKYEKITKPGTAIGLAYTPFGGEILYIETAAVRGKGELIISGQLGEVMKESAMAAISFLKTKTKELNLDYRTFEKYDLHIHVPDGATPKDGPSAGITLATALASLYTQRKIYDKISMTGEITLRGNVLPVGGIKEKILAAKRAGIKTVILSSKNKKDIEEIKKDYLKDISFKFVDNVEEVLDIALQKQKCKNALKWELT